MYENGDRYIFAEDNIFPPLPRTTIIDGMESRIFHRSQKLQMCKMQPKRSQNQ